MASDMHVERLRDATRNWLAVSGVALGDSPPASTADLERANNASGTRVAIEDAAILVLGEIYDESLFDYEAVAAAIDSAEAGWLYPVLLQRAVERVRGGGR